MARRLIVRNVSGLTTPQDLVTAFAGGDRRVRGAEVVSGDGPEGTGSAVIEMASGREARAALAALDGFELNGRALLVASTRLRRLEVGRLIHAHRTGRARRRYAVSRLRRWSRPRPLDWLNTSFLAFTHAMALVAIAYMAFVQFSWWTVLLAFAWFWLSSISITGGYHRLFSHASYRARLPLRAFYLLFGAAAVQNSALKWSADHRVHHAHTDRRPDPYNARRGFWWSHVGWVIFRGDHTASDARNVKDLEASRTVRFQHRFYLPLAILMGGILPFALGSLWGDALGALLVVGFLRLAIQWHFAFSINSFTHKFGAQPFSRRNSARDSFWIALLTLGEGYHNFHHRFPIDYRNGIRWFHFDPTKWWVWTASRVGLAGNLRRVPADRIARARAEASGFGAASN